MEEELGVEGGETIITIYYMRKSIFSKRKTSVDSEHKVKKRNKKPRERSQSI